MNSSENAGSSWRTRMMAAFSSRMISHSIIVVTVAMRSDCAAKHPSPKKSPVPRIATTASLPCSETTRSEEHTSELQSQSNLVCRLLLEIKKQVANPAVDQCHAVTTVGVGRQALPVIGEGLPLPVDLERARGVPAVLITLL